MPTVADHIEGEIHAEGEGHKIAEKADGGVGETEDLRPRPTMDEHGAADEERANDDRKG